MFYIFGLGNPGEKYEQTRHNVGFMFVDNLINKIAGSGVKFISKDKLGGKFYKNANLTMVKPQAYMNKSGEVVKKFIDYFDEVEQVLVKKELIIVHDDLDLELGQFKLQFGVGPELHKGLNSIYSTLETKNFWHLRIGVDDRFGDRSTPSDVYVLEKFPKESLKTLDLVFKDCYEKIKQEGLL